MLFFGVLQLLFASLAPYARGASNRIYMNPILPGWNSDPSCVTVKDTFFCTSSSFLLFPGAPVYTSKDLTNWVLASNALNRPEQLPELSAVGLQNEGIWASTIRYKDGSWYLITAYVSFGTGWHPLILIFTTTDPFDDAAWSVPIRVANPAYSIDPDLFWDDDGKVYMALAGGTHVFGIDLNTGNLAEPFLIWNGTGGVYPEGPHLYKKDGFYYLLIGEGGTETNHTATIARSKNIRGPYEGNPNNPILTAKNTSNFFQTVGHADLFQDASSNWWAVALATRSGPAWEVYPMGRETVLIPILWKEGEWPVGQPVRGKMSGPLPPPNKVIGGKGSLIDDPDRVDFAPGSTLPRHFGHWRFPNASHFSISPTGHRNTLRILPSKVNLTADAGYNPKVEPLAFVARRQTSSVFEYSVDFDYTPKEANEEAGITVFLTQFQHIDLGIVRIPDASNRTSVPSFRFRVEASGKPGTVVPQTVIEPVPRSWDGLIRLSISATKDKRYILSAAPASRPEHSMIMGSASAGIVSGGTGPFMGTIVGAYATSNGGNGSAPAFLSRWRFTPVAQEIDEGVFVPANA